MSDKGITIKRVDVVNGQFDNLSVVSNKNKVAFVNSDMPDELKDKAIQELLDSGYDVAFFTKDTLSMVIE